jgi:chemotaxis protein CheZ
METNLMKEIKELLGLIESFKSEISKISQQKEGFKTVSRHIDTAISESEEATKKIIDLIGNSMETVQEALSLIKELPKSEKREKAEKLLSGTLENLMSALTLLEFQDIMAQRLLRIKGFLSDVEKSILRIVILAGIEEIENERKEDLQKKLEELEWKKEVSQDEVDEIMKQFGM